MQSTDTIPPPPCPEGYVCVCQEDTSFAIMWWHYAVLGYLAIGLVSFVHLCKTGNRCAQLCLFVAMESLTTFAFCLWNVLFHFNYLTGLILIGVSLRAMFNGSMGRCKIPLATHLVASLGNTSSHLAYYRYGSLHLHDMEVAHFCTQGLIILSLLKCLFLSVEGYWISAVNWGIFLSMSWMGQWYALLYHGWLLGPPWSSTPEPSAMPLVRKEAWEEPGAMEIGV
jgi:hypothetical protein